VVKIFAFLDLEQNRTFFKGLRIMTLNRIHPNNNENLLIKTGRKLDGI
jgi:hypothetical protein